MTADVAQRVLRWYRKHGRHDLPWQHPRTLYRVWLAEIMLQQTQVKTVIPYYKNFLRAFPSLKQLALASQDEVLAHWAGLGYYSRARNLHKAAQQVQQLHRGRFPRAFDVLLDLPGIGRSTAAAILSQALDQRHVILDGNVKRVLARYHAIDGWPGLPAVEQQLWRFAEQHTPQRHNADYTQAIMDLGATLCRRSRPDCAQCPLASDCAALANDQVSALPAARPKKTLPVKSARLLLLDDGAGAVLLERRPPSGIWGGLWSLPELAMEDDIASACQQRWGVQVHSATDGTRFRHSFSHYHFDITPCRVQLETSIALVKDANMRWYCAAQTRPLALAAPVQRILQEYA
ncbi:MAG: A/G-specific adenine glycosylase [Gammaproteobacteria bacterium]